MSFTPSHVDLKAPAAKMVVDVTVAFDGKPQTYTVDDSISIAFFGTAAISPDRDSILREIDTYKQTSEQRLASRTRDEEIVAKCTQLLTDNNPELKSKKETEARFAKIEEGQVNLNNKLDKIAQLMEKFIN